MQQDRDTIVTVLLTFPREDRDKNNFFNVTL